MLGAAFVIHITVMAILCMLAGSSACSELLESRKLVCYSSPASSMAS